MVHGRWCYIRNSEMILYFFYKNMIFSVPQFCFSFYNGFSGQTLFDDWYISLYNLVFTSWPLIIRALFDKDYYYKKWTARPSSKEHSDESLNPKALEYRIALLPYFPYLYYIGQQNTIYNIRN